MVVNNSSESIDSESKLKSAISTGKAYFMVGHFQRDSGTTQYLYAFTENMNRASDVSSYNFNCAVWPDDVGGFYFNLLSMFTTDIVVPIINQTSN